ncbi:MAG: 2OG-Fe(II) oxygenase [Pseudomonadota bacterium]|nr:2OG-Fe(II) oxygenase [Pseudomonadota bacterium]
MSGDLELLDRFIDPRACPLDDRAFIDDCRRRLDEAGVVTIPGFLRPRAMAELVTEAEAAAADAFFTSSTHNVYLTPPDPALGPDHVFNRQITSSKGCITTDQVPAESGLHAIYDSAAFRAFIAEIVGETALHAYADPLSSINVHYAAAGQELGWHFDNSSFAVTLLLQAPEAGGAFQYVRDLRDAESGDLNFAGVAAVLDNDRTPDILEVAPGTLVLFRGRNSMHRVTPTIGGRTRILVVLAYNTEPGVALSEAARMTFYGRLG